MTTVYLVEFESKNRTAGTITKHRVCTSEGFITPRFDTEPDVTYLPVIEQAADISIALASYGNVTGDTRVEVGVTTLNNALDRVLGTRPWNDMLETDILFGQKLNVYVVPENGSRDTDAHAIMSAKMEWHETNRKQLILRPRDRTLDFDKQVLKATYTGAGGLNGTADLKDKTKERCFGEVPNLIPTYLGVINGKHTFSVNGGNPIEGVLAVYDNMAALNEVPSNPGQTQYSQDKTTGIITLGAQNFGRITCAVRGDKTAGVWRRTVGGLIRWGAAASGAMTAGEIDGATFDTFEAAVPYTVGRYFEAGSTETWRSFFDELARSVRSCNWYIDSLGKLKVGIVLPASGTPKAEFRLGVNTPGVTPRNTSRAVPAKQTVIKFARNLAVASDTEIADQVKELLPDLLSFSKNEFREARTAEDTNIINLYNDLAEVFTRETLITYRADAEVEAAATQADVSQVLQLYDLPVYEAWPDLQLLDVVKVYDNLPGFESGKLVRIIGRSINHKAGRYSFIVRE